MKQISDIRLGGTLLSVATLICGGFAIAALIPLMQWNPGERASNTPISGPAQPLVHQEQRRFQEFQTPPIDSRPSKESAESPSRDTAAWDSPVSQAMTRSGTAGDQGFEQTPSPHGVYVPVSVTVDGSALAEQLSVLADGMDEMVAAQREASQSYRVATIPPSAGGTTGSPAGDHGEQLKQIDASVRELLNRVETLQTESRTADSRLTEEVRQAKLTSDLVQEFRLALAEHRQFLADSPRSFPSSAARIAKNPETGTDSSSTDHEELLIPEPVDLESEPPLWDALDDIDIDKPDDPDVPLPLDADNRTSSVMSPPASVQVVLAAGEQSPNEAAESKLDADASPATSVSTGGTTERTKESELAFAMFAPTETVIAEPDPGSSQTIPNQSINPHDDMQSTGHVPTDVSPDLAEDAVRGAKPVVFEHTFSFVLPPVTNPLANVQTSGVGYAGRTNYARPAGFQKLPAPSRAARPAPKNHTAGTASVDSDVRPSTLAGHRDGMQRLSPQFVDPIHARPQSTNVQPSAPRMGRHGRGVTPVPSPRPYVNGHVYEATGRRIPRHDSAATKATNRTSLLHRLASSLSRVGQTRTVD